MEKTVKITILVENTAAGPELLAEHGLSYWIQWWDGRAILFDTGQGRVLMQNAFHLKLAWDRLEAVVLSHGHYDHTGGLAQVIRRAREVKIYAHPAFLAPKFACPKNGPVREIRVPSAVQELLRGHIEALQPTESPIEIVPGLVVTGQIPRTNPIEDTGGPFFLDREGKNPDPLVDDQAIFFRSAQGTVVLLGCAHAGVVHTLQFIRQLTDQEPIWAVIGGMHLLHASPERMQFTIDAFRQLGLGLLAPAHCTGWSATAALMNAFGQKCTPCHVGAQFEFSLL